jgi:hypothetical protein
MEEGGRAGIMLRECAFYCAKANRSRLDDLSHRLHMTVLRWLVRCVAAFKGVSRGRRISVTDQEPFAA